MGSTARIWLCWNDMPTPVSCWRPGEHDCCNWCALKAAAHSVTTKYGRCVPPRSRPSSCGGHDPAIALSDLAEEITTEIRLLRLAETERAHHEAARDAALARVDPAGLATSVPGLGPVGATQLLAAMGRPGRFRNAAAFKSFTGLAPKASETGNTDRKSQPMSKAGHSALRTQLIQSANTARQLDPQLAAIYYTQMTERGAPHLKTLCVVAAHLAERAWLTLSRAKP
jgi:transposase